MSLLTHHEPSVGGSFPVPNSSPLRPWLAAGRELLPKRAPARLLAWIAVAGVVSAIFHLGVWAADGGSWSGAVSWRKPIVFGLSIGLLAWTIGWLLDRLPDRRKTAWIIAGLYAVFGTLEVGLITAQTWRGEESHFNTVEGGTNGLIFSLMGISVVFMSISILAVFIWSLISRPDDPAVRIAAYAGFALVVLGLGLGQWLITLGNNYVASYNAVPESVVYGDAGVAKFPHAVALHGVQVFMVAAAMISTAGLARTQARRLMMVIALSYCGLMAFSILQTLAGRAPAEVSTLVSVAVLGCVATLAGGLVLAARRLHTTTIPPRSLVAETHGEPARLG